MVIRIKVSRCYRPQLFMPQNLERDFQKAALKLRRKNRNILKQKISIIIISSLIISGLLYFIFKYNFSPIVTSNIAAILGMILIIGSIAYFIKNKPNSTLSYHFQSSVFRLNLFKDNHFFKSFKIQHYLLLLVLVVAAINPHLIKDYSNRLIYSPKPPLLASPWPWKNNQTIHPIIANITPDIEISIKSVAEYIARQESDPYLQIKALHDYVISRVSYDFPALEMMKQPPQDARTVFSTRKAVCEGYANLFMALGQSIGIDVVFIQGNSRRDLASQTLISLNIKLFNTDNLTLHAWNAVKIAGNWQLVDTTWDDSNLDQNSSLHNSHYLMPPPDVMIVSHFPEQSDWQLLHHPMNRDDFEKQSIPA
jgi:hypothetical protein